MPAPGKVPFARELFIERDDFREDPAAEVLPAVSGQGGRLRNAYFIKCVGW